MSKAIMFMLPFCRLRPASSLISALLASDMSIAVSMTFRSLNLVCALSMLSMIIGFTTLYGPATLALVTHMLSAMALMCASMHVATIVISVFLFRIFCIVLTINCLFPFLFYTCADLLYVSAGNGYHVHGAVGIGHMHC